MAPARGGLPRRPTRPPRRDGYRALTYGGGVALWAAASYTPHRKHTGEARFEQVRRAAERPLRRGELVGGQRRACFDESLVIERQTAGEPLRARLGAGHRE